MMMLEDGWTDELRETSARAVLSAGDRMRRLEGEGQGVVF